MTAVRQSERDGYRERGYVLLEQLFPPLILDIFHGKMQQDLNLKGNPAFIRKPAC